jgi:hypothetical protein
VNSDEAIIIAAAVGSLPGWGAFGMAIYTQRRALPKQTAQLKDHIDSATAGPVTVPAPPPQSVSDYDPCTAAGQAGALPITLEVAP